jgi:probable phosphoglycerate mutase
MTDLYLIRHGEATSNVDPYIIGGEKGCMGLTERGHAQAKALGERMATGEFSFDILYSSTLPRARQTAEYVTEGLEKMPILWDDDLHELRPGECDGLTIAEARARYSGFATFFDDLYTPLSPGGESWADFHLRIARTLDRILRAHTGKRIAIVAHGGVVEVSFLYFLGLGTPTRTRNAFHVRNTSITHWRHTESYGRHEWQLVCHNDHAHLRGTGL